ncbi:hypothetical protein ACHAWC_010789, partial [Mediolabrus comicus]
DQKIGTSNKLFWNERRQKKTSVIYPVRVVPREEVVGLSLKDWDAETERAVQYIQYPHKSLTKRNLGLYDVVSLRSLTPYNGGGDDGSKDSWCTKKMEQYSKQLKRTLKGGLTDIDLITEKTFLNLVLKQSLKEEEYEKERNAILDRAAETSLQDLICDKEDKQAENDSDDNNSDDDDMSDNVKSEPLRVGDVIEYYKPNSVAGNPDALCEAEVKFINPKGDPILVTTDVFTILPPDHQVKRVKRMHRGKLHHHNGRFRAINNYVLKKEGVSFCVCVCFCYEVLLFPYSITYSMHCLILIYLPPRTQMQQKRSSQRVLQGQRQLSRERRTKSYQRWKTKVSVHEI